MRKALIVGVNDYPGAQLRGCVNDANAIASVLETHADGGPNFSVKLLTSPPDVVTRSELRGAIERLFAGDCDVCLFYFSGHGTIKSTGGYIVTTDAKKYDEGVSMDEILLLANQSKAKDKVVLLDCCHSGALGTPTITGGQVAHLSEGLTSLSAWGVVSANQGCIKAKKLAQRALEIDHGLAEAHTALAYATMYHYDFLDAEKEFERAIEINPRYAGGHHLFGLYLAVMGHYEEAYTEFQRALRLDPLTVSQSLLGFNYLYSRRYDQAVSQFIRTLELAPDEGPAQCGLGWAYSCKSMHEPALAAMRKGLDLWPGSTPRAWLGEFLAVAGYRDDAQMVLEQLFVLSKERYVTPYGVARIYNALGRTDDALQWLETAYHQQAEWMLLLKVDPCFDNLRSTSCFEDLMRRMNFPP